MKKEALVYGLFVLLLILISMFSGADFNTVTGSEYKTPQTDTAAQDLINKQEIQDKITIPKGTTLSSYDESSGTAVFKVGEQSIEVDISAFNKDSKEKVEITDDGKVKINGEMSVVSASSVKKDSDGKLVVEFKAGSANEKSGAVNKYSSKITYDNNGGMSVKNYYNGLEYKDGMVEYKGEKMAISLYDEKLKSEAAAVNPSGTDQTGDATNIINNNDNIPNDEKTATGNPSYTMDIRPCSEAEPGTSCDSGNGIFITKPYPSPPPEYDAINPRGDVIVTPDSSTIPRSDRIESPGFTIDFGVNVKITNGAISIGSADSASFQGARKSAKWYFVYKNIKDGTFNVLSSDMRFSLSSSDGNSTLFFGITPYSDGENISQYLKNGGVEVNWTGEITIEVSDETVTVTGENVTLRTDNEVVVGDISTIVIESGEIKHVGIGQNSRYEYLGDQYNDNQNIGNQSIIGADEYVKANLGCREPIAIYNSGDEWFQMYIRKTESEQVVPDMCYSNCGILSFVNNTFVGNDKFVIERESELSYGWEKVAESKCIGNQLYLQFDQCLTHSSALWGLEDQNDPDTYEQTVCLNLYSSDFYAKTLGKTTYTNYNPYPKPYFITSYLNWQIHNLNIDRDKEQSRYFTAYQEDSNLSWSSLIATMDEVLTQIQ